VTSHLLIPFSSKDICVHHITGLFYSGFYYSVCVCATLFVCQDFVDIIRVPGFCEHYSCARIFLCHL